MEISSKSAKISAHFELPLDVELEIGSDCLVGLEAVISSVSDESEEDGTKCRVWRLKAIKGEIAPKNGVKVVLKDKTKHSVRMRQMISLGWGEKYEKVMDVLLARGDELQSFYEKHRI